MSRRFKAISYIFLMLAMILTVPGPRTALGAAPVINPISLQSAVQTEQQATAALSNAEKVLKMARDIHDAEAEAVTAEAVRIAKRALKQARERKHDLEIIVHTIKKRQPGPGAGSVAAMQGDVYIRTGEGDLKIGPEFILQQGDEIVTGSNAHLELALQGGSRIRLGADSAFIATQMKDGFSFSLVFGKYMAKVRQLRKRRFRVRTPEAVCGVRGTEFEVERTTSGTTVVVRSGVVEVTPRGGKAVMVRAGWRIHVDPDGRGSLEIAGGLSMFTPGANAARMQDMI